MTKQSETDIAESSEESGGDTNMASPANTARLVIGSIALQAGTSFVAKMVDRAVLGTPPENPAPNQKSSPGRIRKFTAARLAKVATKSKPGAIAVAGGLLVKHLFDRGGKRLQAKRDAHQELSRKTDR